MTRRETGKFHQEIAKLQALRISVRGDAPVESRHREPEKDSSTLVIDEGILIVNLVGRIDAISAPDLLQAYETIAKGGCFQEIRVEAEKMTYLSSTGVRILLLMAADCQKGKIHIRHMNDTAKKFLAVNDPAGRFLVE